MSLLKKIQTERNHI